MGGTRPPRETDPGILRLAGSLDLPLGPRWRADTVAGYPIDMSIKSEEAEWPREWMVLRGGSGADSAAKVSSAIAGRAVYVGQMQWGLGCFERYLAGDGERWLAAALELGRYLVWTQERGGRYDGGWLHRFVFPHTYPLHGPWLSAMAQGEGASMLVRLYGETREEAFAEAARRALRPLRVPARAGGTLASLGGGPFLEEYPTDPPSFVLNGTFFALWGLHDVALAFDDATAAAWFEEAVDVLARELRRWDTGRWSRYDLFPHRIANLANPFYHRLHITLLHAMQRLAPRAEFAATSARFEDYARRPANITLAFAQKAVFRASSPRHQAFQRLLPWAS